MTSRRAAAIHCNGLTLSLTMMVLLAGAGCGIGETPAALGDLAIVLGVDAAAPDLVIADAAALDATTGDARDAAPCDGCANPVDLAGSDGALLPFLAVCTMNEQCESRICHLFPGTGETVCTKACTVDADCPAPSPGCNKTGLCRIH